MGARYRACCINTNICQQWRRRMVDSAKKISFLEMLDSTCTHGNHPFAQPTDTFQPQNMLLVL